MMYKMQEGILLEYICDQPILIATDQVESECPFMKQLNETAGMYCQQLINGATFEQLYQFAMDQFEGDAELIRKDLNTFLSIMQKEGYLVIEEE